MVTSVTSLTGNGLKDWLVQRATAVYFGVYALYLLAFVLTQPHLTYADWQLLFHCKWFQVGSVIALVAFLLHAWVGIWTVTTDYLKGKALRLFLQLLVVLCLLGQFLWGLMIVWGQ